MSDEYWGTFSVILKIICFLWNYDCTEWSGYLAAIIIKCLEDKLTIKKTNKS